MAEEISKFETKTIRRIWHNKEWFYSIIDVIEVLSDSSSPRKYWVALKARAQTEGFVEALVNIQPLKFKSSDGRMRQTDAANRQTLLRIIQSIPSPKAEPLRLWLAQVGEERIEEIENPALALDRMKENYRAKGYDDQWIDQRIKTDVMRNELTDEWKERGAREGVEYAILTNEINQGTFELSIQAHKQYKLLPTKTNLRDHMTTVELALISLGEATATLLHRDRDTQGFDGLKTDARDAGKAAGKARKVIEEEVGFSVVSPKNFLPAELPAAKSKKRLKEADTDTSQAQLQMFLDPSDKDKSD